MTARLHVMVLPTRYPARTETFVSLEVAEMRRRGVLVDVVALEVIADRDPEGGGVEWIYREHSTARLLLAHLTCIVLRPIRYLRFLRLFLGSGREAEGSWRHLPWWTAEVRRRGVDVLHAHFAWSSATRAWALSTLSGVPWVVTAHAHDIFASPSQLVEKLTAADAAITVCEYNRRELRALGVQRDVDIVVCGVDEPPAVVREPEPARICTVARLVPKKGVDVLIEAIALLRDRGIVAHLEIVGDGPEEVVLRALAEARDVTDRITFTGAIDHEATLAAIESAAVFAFAARIAPDGDRDSMPVVIKEAMARSRPVVATDIVAIPEMVDDTTGWLVPPDDPEALARALQDALSDPDGAARRGAAGRERVRESFLERDQAAVLEGVYRRVVAARSRA